ncbi:MAG: hypothetical protein Q8Q80_04635 [Methyloversatilis sp.]|uniref:hypothetical protein n=1 Tax=Methyloversatilis sp. TaxID=2569862 RepID=UPI0027326A72|nr:hypothetical protein [Methyloversatilis sp.]MDP3871930.1 hypothetical protein [Methyloversatilis sp.]
MTRLTLLILPFAVLLAGCDIENAAFMIENKDHALTLNREKTYFWSDEYKLAIIVSRMPTCQRRYVMKPARLTAANVSVFGGGEPNRYLLRQGSRWYAVNTTDCAFAVVEKPPEVPEAIGVFRRKDDVLTFVKSTTAEAEQR